ncbi:acyl-CoA reductase [Alteromonas hispanica]|uniref:Acyl-CoA reductase n=1 Tax=Alteromonas hispanica TaxID=315421 RepID=A0A6L9MR97_9ALTE|nr:acyl-CoA reductase [Alteromonas hispanica]NDW20652.1 acyl-CoA reductase [Alteromonas hispanica]
MSWTTFNPPSVKAKLFSSFSEQDIAYCDALSALILKEPQIREFPDLVALGFWLRKSNLYNLLKPYQYASFNRQPLGMLYHSAPANVDSLFVYSGILSLLCGNKNVIRLSSRRGTSSNILIEKICQLADDFPEQNARFQLIQCDYDNSELIALINSVEGRVLWGSDEAIIAQRAIPMPAHAREMCFGNKFSLCLLDAKTIMAEPEAKFGQFVQFFYKDQMTFSQQGCSSAKAIVWLGSKEQIGDAKKRFWPALIELVRLKQPFSDSEHYQALLAAQQIAANAGNAFELIQERGITRLGVSSISPFCTNAHKGSGLFLELSLASFEQLNPMLKPANQTLSVWGVEPKLLHEWLTTVQTGVDRVVPVGEALTFSINWDGVDLIDQFSRKVNLHKSFSLE